jgi:hypothetical protein
MVCSSSSPKYEAIPDVETGTLVQAMGPSVDLVKATADAKTKYASLE